MADEPLPPEEDPPFSATAGGTNAPDSGGVGAPDVGAPVSLPSVAAPPDAGPNHAQTAQTIQQLQSLLQPKPENTLQQILRVALPALGMAVYGGNGGGGAFMQAFNQGDQQRQQRADQEAQRRERLAIAIRDLQTQDAQLARQRVLQEQASQKQLRDQKASELQYLAKVTEPSLKAWANGGGLEQANAFIDAHKDDPAQVDAYLGQMLKGHDPIYGQNTSLKYLIAAGLVGQDPNSGHLVYDAKKPGKQTQRYWESTDEHGRVHQMVDNYDDQGNYSWTDDRGLGKQPQVAPNYTNYINPKGEVEKTRTGHPPAEGGPWHVMVPWDAPLPKIVPDKDGNAIVVDARHPDRPMMQYPTKLPYKDPSTSRMILDWIYEHASNLLGDDTNPNNFVPPDQ